MTTFKSAKNYYELIKLSEDKNLTLDSGSLFTKITRGRNKNIKLSDSDQKLQDDVSDLVSEYISLGNLNCHLAETASSLNRLLYYEGSALKKQITSINEREKELTKELEHFHKNLEISKENFKNLCEQHNLDLDLDIIAVADLEKDIKNQLLRSCYKLQDFSSNISKIILSEKDNLFNMIKSYDNSSNSISIIPQFLDNLPHKNEDQFKLDEKILTAIGQKDDEVDVEDDIDWSAYIEEDAETNPQVDASPVNEIPPESDGSAQKPPSASNSDTSDSQKGSWDMCESDKEDLSSSRHLNFLSKNYRTRMNLELSELKSFYKSKLFFSGNSVTDILGIGFGKMSIGGGTTREESVSKETCQKFLDGIERIENCLNESNFIG